MPAAPPARLARAAFLGVLAAALAGSAALGAAPAPPAQQASDALAHDILKQLIAINTTDSVGSVTAAAEAMGQRLRAAGFAAADLTLLGPQARKQNLVVRLRGTGAHKAVLLLGHLDVVEAHREDWSTDPFELVEKGGRFYGRGTLDMKGPDAIMVATLIRLRQEGFRPARDIILALTADEEGGHSNGVDWLLKNRRELIDAELAHHRDPCRGCVLSRQIIVKALHRFIAQTLLLMDRLEAGTLALGKNKLAVAAGQTTVAPQPVEFLTKRALTPLTPEPACEHLQ